MAHLDVSNIDYFLSDGRQLLNGVGFKVGDGAKTALIGPNGTGKTTLLRIIAGDVAPDDGAVARSGSMGIMRQFVGQVRDQTTVRDLLVGAAPPALAAAARAVDEAELAMMEHDDEPTQMRYAQAIADWGDAGGYEQETVWDEVTMASLGVPFDRAQYRNASTLSGGEQKRLVLEALFSGPDELLLLDEPDNYLDVPGKRWLEDKLRESRKSVLFVSHDRELLANAATRIVTLEPGALGATTWIHGGGFESYLQARDDRNARFEELRKRWDEEHAKLKELVNMYKNKAAFRVARAALAGARGVAALEHVDALRGDAVAGARGPESGLGQVDERRDRLRGLGPVELEGEVAARRLDGGDEGLAGSGGLGRDLLLLLRGGLVGRGSGAACRELLTCGEPARARRGAGGRRRPGRGRGRVGAADELRHDDDGRDDEDDREDHTEDLLVARRVAHRRLGALLLLLVAAARTCAFLLFGHEPLLVRAAWAVPGRSVILWNDCGAHAAGRVTSP